MVGTLILMSIYLIYDTFHAKQPIQKFVINMFITEFCDKHFCQLGNPIGIEEKWTLVKKVTL